MPVRKRQSKRRLGADYATWCEAFQFEYDYFGTLAEAGIPVDAYGPPDRDQVAAAWRLYGWQFLSDWSAAKHHPDDPGPWALQAFGKP